MADELEAALRGTLPLEERLADQARPMPAGAVPPPRRRPSTTVTVDNSASAASTVVEIRAADAVGLLHRITTSLFELDLDVVAARVSTSGHEVVDAFYVRDKATGGKVVDAAPYRSARAGRQGRNERSQQKWQARRAKAVCERKNTVDLNRNNGGRWYDFRR